MNDHYNLDRFIGAQAKVYASVLEELRAGKKCGHWVWYIFPQIKGPGARGQGTVSWQSSTQSHL